MTEKSQQELSFFDWEKQMESGAGTNTFREPDANSTFERIYQVVCLAGNKKWSRVVGYALHVNPEPGKIPCHRVVNRLGEPSSAFAFGGVNRQIELLEAEGITFVDGRVDMNKYQWEL